jgi:hypothetical protein
MHVVDVTLTSANVERSVALWADRGVYSPGELAQVVRVLCALFARRCAHGTIITVNGVARACGLSAFVHPAVLDAEIAHPLPLLAKRLLLSAAPPLQGPPFLDEADIARGNAGDGLHLLILQANIDTSTGDGDVLLAQLTRAFYRLHYGYRLARVVADYVGPAAVGVARAGEFDVIREFPTIAPGVDIPSALVVLTPAAAAARGSTTIQTFAYNPPRIMFTAREQELLRAALDGAPDDIVAGRLGVGLSSVKARWTRVQQRAMQMAPELFHSVPLPRQPHRRGAQTRHLVLEYVREHRAELTPYLRDHRRAPRARVATAGHQLQAEPPGDRESRDTAADVAAAAVTRRDPDVGS